jgi:hypothetical protein
VTGQERTHRGGERPGQLGAGVHGVGVSVEPVDDLVLVVGGDRISE